MTLETNIKLILGEQAFTLAALSFQVEELKQQLEDKKKDKKVVSS